MTLSMKEEGIEIKALNMKITDCIFTSASITGLDYVYYPLPNKRTGTIGKKLLRSGGGLAWVRSKKLSEILVGTFIRVGTILE